MEKIVKILHDTIDDKGILLSCLNEILSLNPDSEIQKVISDHIAKLKNSQL